MVTSRNPDNIIQLMERIKRWQAEKRELDRETKEMLGVRIEDLGLDGIAPPNGLSADHIRNLPFKEAVYLVVKSKPGRRATSMLPDVLALGATSGSKTPRKMVDISLQTLKKEGRVENREDGWYPTDTAQPG